MSNEVSLAVRVSANLDEMRTRMAEATSIVETTSSAMKAMANAYDGTRTIANANAALLEVQKLGGVTTLTTAEQARLNSLLNEALSKYQALGKEAPAGMQKLADETKSAAKAGDGFAASLATVNGYLALFGVSLTVGALISFAKDALAGASAVGDLSHATGLTTDEVQRFGYVGAGFNISTEEMAKGVSTLSTRLAHGDASAVQAVNMLGFSVKGLMALGPAEAFIVLSEAAGRVQDPMMKSGIESDLFGEKLGRLMLRIRDLREKFDEVPPSAIISQEQIDRANDFDARLAHLTITLKGYAVDGIGALAYLFPNLIGGFKDTGDEIKHTGKNIVLLTDNSTLLANRLEALRADALVPLNAEQRSAVIELTKYGVSQSEIAKLVGTTEIAVHKFTEENKAAAAEAKKLADTLAREMAFALEQVTKLQDEYNVLRVQQGGTATDVQISQIHRWADDLTARMVKAKADTAEFYDWLAKTVAEKLNMVEVDWAALGAASIESLQQTADKAQATFDEAVYGSLHFSTEAIQHFRNLRDAAIEALHPVEAETAKAAKGFEDIGKAAKKAHDDMMAMGGSVDYGTPGAQGQDPAVVSLLHDGYSLAQAAALAMALKWGYAINMNDPLFQTKGPRVPGYAEGVMNAPGGWATVGERGPETMYVPQGANIYPHGSGAGGGTTTVQVYVSGVWDARSQRELTTAVSEGIMARQRQIGQRMPVGA